jgi:PAS domain S-box-containing protein
MPTDSTNATQAAEAELAAFDARDSPRGRLRRYAEGRIRNFGTRQILMAVGSVSLTLLTGPEIGLLVLAFALGGEGIDCGYLNRVIRRLDEGADDGPLRLGSTITAAVQSGLISACIALAVLSTPGDTAVFFAMAYLTGAAMNAGIVAAFHRDAALARLGVFALTPALLFAADWVQGGSASLGYDVMGTLIVAYIVYVFTRYVTDSYARSVAHNRGLLEQQLALARASEALAQQQAEARKLALVAQHANDSILITDPDWRITWVNDAFERQTGYRLVDARGRRPGDLLHGPRTDPDAASRILTAVRRGENHRDELINYTATGRAMWTEVNLAPIRGETGAVDMIISVEREITVAKQHARELARAKEAAEAAARAKADFLATMSHEIRTPMNGIIGMAELLCDAPLPPQEAMYAGTIRGSAESLLAILNDILDLSKLEAGKLDITPAPFDPRATVEEAAALLRTEAAHKGVALRVEADADMPARVMGDAGRLRQIVINLVGNAVKFTSQGHVTARLAAEPAGGRHLLRLDVEDTGIGIEPGMLEHIFDRFTQAESDTTRRFGGTGLGLTISRMLARRMGGDITARSTPGEGSVFTATVRAGVVDPASLDDASPVDTGPPVDLSRVRVLVAEDNAINRLLLEKILETVGIVPTFADNGVDAVEIATREKPDLIFMDMSMPRLNGLDATRAIRAEGGPQPFIVALTANAFASDRDICLAAGMDDFLSKPVRRAQLVEKLKAAAARGSGAAGVEPAHPAQTDA